VSEKASRDDLQGDSRHDGGTAWSILRELIAQGERRFPALRALLVAAHPDDETIGAGALLARLPRCEVLYLTDGAPRDLRWAPAVDPRAGGSRDEYGRARRREAARALSLVGLSEHSLAMLSAVDQEAAFHLPDLARELASRFHRFAPDLVVTHPYEGGHPDHDAAAFAVHAAAEVLRRRGLPVPAIVEMTSYHARDGSLVAGEFLPVPGADGTATLVLSDKERALKSRMLLCFETQRQTLAQFPPSGRESFRLAPVYRFTEPPHPGPLLYEIWGFPLDGGRWRELARQALRELDLPEDSVL
jgi:LmbE family N-acetylglucosaminyl deacetylase